MNFDIRPATAKDMETIILFNIELALESENLRLDPETVRRGVRKSLSDPSMGRYYLACRGDEILGQIRVTLEWSDGNNAQYWWIQNVYVDAQNTAAQAVYRNLNMEQSHYLIFEQMEK